MTPEFDTKGLVDELFRLTGKKMSASDPLVIAALFYSHQMRQASEAAAVKIIDASGEAHAAVRTTTLAAESVADAARSVEAVCLQLGGERAAIVRMFAEERIRAEKEYAARAKMLADAFEARQQKSLLQVLKGQSIENGATPLAVWHVLGGALVGAVAVVLATCFAAGFSYSWVSDAADGRAINRILPKLDPDVKAKIMDQLREDLDN